MTTNRLKHIEPSSSVPTGGDTIKARALASLSVDQSALEDKIPDTYSPIKRTTFWYLPRLRKQPIASLNRWNAI
jgi:hypothetical protein